MSTRKDKFSLKDKKFMELALNLASARKGLTGDNPAVGCLIVKNDKIISIGQTGFNGRPHAEDNAIKNSLENSWHNTIVWETNRRENNSFFIYSFFVNLQKLFA